MALTLPATTPLYFPVAAPGVPVEEEAALEFICQWLLRHTGQSFPNEKRDLLYRKLQTLSWRLGLTGVPDMAAHLRLNDRPRLPAEIIHAATVSYTFFFREPEMLGLFQEQILPTLPPDEPWHLWSAAMASGEEAYTLAILAADYLGWPRAQTQVAVLGSDISWPMIHQAEHGVYVEQRMELVPPTQRQRYFQPLDNGEWHVNLALKQLCTFRQLNLLKSHAWPFRKPFHVIFCRNVLYYFDPEHQQAVLERLYDVTAPGGWLVTSVTENPDAQHLRWRKVRPGMYRKG